MSMSKAISKQMSRSLNSGSVTNPKISAPAAAALQSSGSVFINVPQKFFSFDTAPINADGEKKAVCSSTVTDACRKPTSEMRFRKRNDFFIRRHLARDHIIRAQHYDIRIAAIRATETLQDAVRRHKMVTEEAAYWGPFAAGTSLYASFLRGDERVKAEIACNNTAYPWDHESDSSPINTLYCEGFAVGEVRGYANFDQVRSLRAPAEKEDTNGENTESDAVDPADLPDRISPGDGVMKMSKILYGLDKPFTSTTRATGNAQVDWQEMYNQSEQIPSFILLSADLDSEKKRTPKLEDGTLRPAEDLVLSENDVEFCGGVLIQVLGGPSDPTIAMKILADRPEAMAKEKARAEEIAAKIAEIDADVNSLSVSIPAGDSSDTPSQTVSNPEEESDHAYVKRMQLQQLREKALTLDMSAIMKKRGVAAFVAALLDTDIESLGKSPSYQQGNPTGEFDYEALESRLIQKTKLPAEVAEEDLLPEEKFESKAWKYHPIAFFCRCTQTKPEEKLGQLPNELLYELVEDGGAEFTCEYCNTHTAVTVEQITGAIRDKNQK